MMITNCDNDVINPAICLKKLRAANTRTSQLCTLDRLVHLSCLVSLCSRNISGKSLWIGRLGTVAISNPRNASMN